MIYQPITVTISRSLQGGISVSIICNTKYEIDTINACPNEYIYIYLCVCIIIDFTNCLNSLYILVCVIGIGK